MTDNNQRGKAAGRRVRRFGAPLLLLAGLIAGGVTPATAAGTPASTGPASHATAKPAPGPPAGVPVGHVSLPKPRTAHPATTGPANVPWSVSLTTSRCPFPAYGPVMYATEY